MKPVVEWSAGLFALLFVLCAALISRQAVPAPACHWLLGVVSIGLVCSVVVFARREVQERNNRT